MSKLNKKVKTVSKTLAPVAISYNGNPQYAKSAKQELFELAVSFMFGKDTFYESSDTQTQRLHKAIATLVAMNEFDFIANTIKYARTTMHIRTAPLMMSVMFAHELRRQNKSYENLRSVVRDVIQRADQLKDMYAYALDVFGEKHDKNKKKTTVPMAIKRGVGDAFSKFNEYQFAKWKGSGEELKLRDVLWITHPTPASAYHGKVFDKIMQDTLAVPFTWEVELSKNGQLPVGERLSDKDLWTKLVSRVDDKGRYAVGYMALLRNLRNIQNAQLDTNVLKKHVFDRLTDPTEVLASKQLPFDFVEAYEAVTEDARIRAAISTALDISVANMPVLGEKVWVLVDNSASMNNTYEQLNNHYSRGNTKEKIKGVGASPAITSAIFAAALYKASTFESRDFAITLFSDRAVRVTGLNPTDSVLTIAKQILQGIRVPSGTNLSVALATKGSLGFEPDAVVLFSDGQVDIMPYGTAKQTDIFKKNCVKVSFNLGAYASTPTPEQHGWYQFSGWSSNIFEFAPLMREKVSIVEAMSVPYTPEPRRVASQEEPVVKKTVKRKKAPTPEVDYSVTTLPTTRRKLVRVEPRAAKKKTSKPKTKKTVSKAK